ncbi:ABC transporter substrate-binding protein [Rhodoplanes sp. Z2-YC6860]|uniref:ABC transporter substrate-binding protein n=1 Tax=Rhodoplanes sp. Z2-YC6860 TaxID=674703 RepID=UPI00078BD584|nr:ABC transporter substrate-binding protein [Rhodoplanes sp. Z2-YC6860]AMN40795.1 ABC transporter substrate-binding protein [Rhodoplanes sp. Z2-YC6860]
MAAMVKIALVSRTVFYAPVWVAQENGYFADEGIEPKFEIFDNAEKINGVMHSGEAQIAIASIEALVADAFKGGKFRVVASVAQKPPHFIIARPHIKSVTELRGARFGVLSLHEGTTYFVQDIEKALGWTRGDIVIDAVGGAPTRWKLLREGKIDAGLQPFPLSYESEAAGFSNLGPIVKYVPDYEFTAVFLDPAWAAANRAAVTGALRAMRRGQAAMAADPGTAAKVLVKELGTTEAYARRGIADALNFKLMPDGLAASEKGMRRVFTTLQSAGLVPKDAAFDMARFVDPSYLAAAR